MHSEFWNIVTNKHTKHTKPKSIHIPSLFMQSFHLTIKSYLKFDKENNLHDFPGIYFKRKTLVMALVKGRFTNTYTRLTAYWQTFRFFFENLKVKMMWKALCPFKNQQQTVYHIFCLNRRQIPKKVYPSCFIYAPTSFHHFLQKETTYFFFFLVYQTKGVPSGQWTGRIKFLPTLLSFCINKK